METIKLSLFDIFAYALPGVFVLLGIIILADDSLVRITLLPELLGKLNLGTAILSILTAYVLGFALDSPASWFYYGICCRVGGNPMRDTRAQYSVTRETEKRLLQVIRDRNSGIIAFLQTWKLLKTMSHNLAFTFLIFATTILAKITFYSISNPVEWFMLSGGSLVVSLILSQRAKIFDQWHYNDLFNAGIALGHLSKDGQFVNSISAGSTGDYKNNQQNKVKTKKKK